MCGRKLKTTLQIQSSLLPFYSGLFHSLEEFQFYIETPTGNDWFAFFYNLKKPSRFICKLLLLWIMMIMKKEIEKEILIFGCWLNQDMKKMIRFFILISLLIHVSSKPASTKKWLTLNGKQEERMTFLSFFLGFLTLIF